MSRKDAYPERKFKRLLKTLRGPIKYKKSTGIIEFLVKKLSKFREIDNYIDYKTVQTNYRWRDTEKVVIYGSQI